MDSQPEPNGEDNQDVPTNHDDSNILDGTPESQPAEEPTGSAEGEHPSQPVIPWIVPTTRVTFVEIVPARRSGCGGGGVFVCTRNEDPEIVVPSGGLTTGIFGQTIFVETISSSRFGYKGGETTNTQPDSKKSDSLGSQPTGETEQEEDGKPEDKENEDEGASGQPNQEETDQHKESHQSETQDLRGNSPLSTLSSPDQFVDDADFKENLYDFMESDSDSDELEFPETIPEEPEEEALAESSQGN